MEKKIIVSWVMQVVVALIFFQTLFFKFTGASEAVAIFTKLGVEPWGRWLTGILELGAGAMLLIPGTIVIGAILSLIIIIPAIVLHFAVLGISSNNDGGLLFALAIIVLILSLAILWIRRSRLKKLLRKS